MATINPKHLKMVPRAVLYGIGIAGAVVVILAVIAELQAPGIVQRVREATESVVVEIGLILAALAALVPPALALFNLKEDAPSAQLKHQGYEQSM